MKLGKYPFETYGYHGGSFSRQQPADNLARAIGHLFGLIIGGVFVLTIGVLSGFIKFAVRSIQSAGNGLLRGLKDGLNEHE